MASTIYPSSPYQYYFTLKVSHIVSQLLRFNSTLYSTQRSLEELLLLLLALQRLPHWGGTLHLIVEAVQRYSLPRIIQEESFDAHHFRKYLWRIDVPGLDHCTHYLFQETIQTEGKAPSYRCWKSYSQGNRSGYHPPRKRYYPSRPCCPSRPMRTW